MLMLMIRRPSSFGPAGRLCLVSLALLGAVLRATSAGAQPPQQAAPAAADVTFRLFARGQPIGSETVSVLTLPDGWKIRTTGQIAAPIALTTRIAEIVYDRDWSPRTLFVDGLVKGQTTTLKTTFSGTSATSDIVQDARSFQKTDTVDARTIVLPNLIFGFYEAVSARISVAQPGASFRVYVVPQTEIAMTVDTVSAERVSAPGRIFEARKHGVTFHNPGGPLKVDVWTDGPRLMRVSIPSAALDVIRDDIASVATRQTTEYRPNDEDVRIPANGFNLAGTLSKPLPPGAQAAAAGTLPGGGTTAAPGLATPAQPASPPRREAPEATRPTPLPAVVLVSGSGPLDRDETVMGIPIFGQLASSLADAGFAVLRYDKRGVGQSGGRAESSTLTDYAEDLIAAVKFLEKRKDVDRKRIAVVGHSEGAAVALLAARREKRIGALVLVAGPGTTGAELVLEQQQRLLNRANLPAEEKASKVALQKKVQEAVLTGKGWEEIPEALRKQAETPWFASLLAFDPAKIVPRVDQRMLIVQPALDAQVPPHHAEKLAALANRRKNKPETTIVTLPGVNHLLVPATTGEIDEYRKLASRTITPQLADAIATWLK
jgi:pimeloyl-ACP methyl ester carboxylesterase